MRKYLFATLIAMLCATQITCNPDEFAAYDLPDIPAAGTFTLRALEIDFFGSHLQAEWSIFQLTPLRAEWIAYQQNPHVEKFISIQGNNFLMLIGALTSEINPYFENNKEKMAAEFTDGHVVVILPAKDFFNQEQRKTFEEKASRFKEIIHQIKSIDVIPRCFGKIGQSDNGEEMWGQTPV